MTRDVLAFPKPVRLRSLPYLAWIRRQGCLICGSAAQAHHIETGGVGTKGSDFRTTPLCHRCHRELHRIGSTRFEAEHRVDLYEEAFRLLETFVSALRSGEVE